MGAGCSRATGRGDHLRTDLCSWPLRRLLDILEAGRVAETRCKVGAGTESRRGEGNMRTGRFAELPSHAAANKGVYAKRYPETRLSLHSLQARGPGPGHPAL